MTTEAPEVSGAPTAIYCAECGHRLPEDAEYCDNCGTHRGEAHVEPPPPPPASAIAPPQTPRRPWLIPVIVGAAIGLLLLLLLVVLLVVPAVLLNDDGDGEGSGSSTEAAPATTPFEEPLSADGPFVFAGRTFTIVGVGPIDQFPEDCVGTTCSEPLPGREYLQVSFTVEPATDGPDPQLDQLARQLELQYEGAVAEGTAFTTAWSVGPDTFDAVFEVPEEASDFVLAWPDGSLIDLDDA
jgi:hypothetical protein